MALSPVPYSPEVEIVEADEAEAQAGLIETFSSIIETVHTDTGHAYRSVHAKSHALLEGELIVRPDLPAELAQGIFSSARTYPILARISTNAGDVLPDSISLARGLAIKVIGVEGERLPGSEGDVTQDFVMAAGKSFAAPNAKAFLKNLKLLAATTDRMEWGKKAISAVFRVTEKALEAVGGESALLKSLGGYPNSHPLGESFFSQAPIRFGQYMGKVGVVPLSASFKALEGTEIAIDGRENALREEVNKVLNHEGGEWELRVQLCRDLEADPIEDASVVWPEEDNPYLAIATIRIPAQPGWTQEKADRIDDQTSFSPWHGILAHQPLGNIMRARKPAYAASAGLRSSLNGCPMHEPRSATETG